MTRILINFNEGTGTPDNALPGQWNSSSDTTVGTSPKTFPDLVDEDNVTTGISMHVGTGSVFSDLGSGGAGGGDFEGYSEQSWKTTWHSTGDDDTLVFQGFAANQAGTIKFAGWVTVGWNTRLRASSGDVEDWVASARPPNVPATLDFVADGSGNLTLTSEVVSTFAYVNPVVALFLGHVIGGETLSMNALVGALVILSGVALITAGQQQALPHSSFTPSRRRS